MGSWRIDHPDRLAIDTEIDRVEVKLVAGRLNIVGTDGPARVEFAAVGAKPVLVSDDGGVLRVGHEPPPRWPGLMWWLGQLTRRYKADVSIAVPRGAAADLRVGAGSVVVSGLGAGVAVDVTGGRITLLGLDGRVTAKIVSGPIEALGIAGELSLETVSGEITLADAAAHRVSARTISGAVTCDLDNPYDSEIRLETTSGEITLRVREDSDLDVHLHAISGRVTSAFPELPAGNQPGGRTVQGSLGAGTGRLCASAVSGNISLLRRPVGDDQPVEETT